MLPQQVDFFITVLEEGGVGDYDGAFLGQETAIKEGLRSIIDYYKVRTLLARKMCLEHTY